MAFVPVPNTAQVELRFTLNGNRAENTLWFDQGSSITTTMLSDLTGAIYDWWVDQLAPITGNDVQLREVYASDQSTQTGAEFTYSPAAVALGGASTSAATSSITLAVAFRTGQRGRSFRGRNYAVGIPVGFVTKDTISSGYANAYRAAYTSLLSGLVTYPGTWVVASRYANKVPRATGVTTPILGVSLVDNTVDNQRRRLTGRGE